MGRAFPLASLANALVVPGASCCCCSSCLRALVWRIIGNTKSRPELAGMAECHQWRTNTDPSQGGFWEPDELQHLELPVPPFLPLCFTACGHPVPCPEPGWHLKPSDPCHKLSSAVQTLSNAQPALGEHWVPQLRDLGRSEGRFDLPEGGRGGECHKGSTHIPPTGGRSSSARYT